MVVIPTKSDVTLTYGLTGVDWLGRAGTLVGVAALVGLVFWHPAPSRRAQSEDGDSDGDGALGEPDDDDLADGERPDRSEPAPALP
jgi:hypothetical protein